MPIRLLALLLALLSALPTAAGATLHRCGSHIVLSCGCEHTGPAVESGDNLCCSNETLPAAAPAVLTHADVAPDALPLEPVVLHPASLPEPAHATPIEARPAAPPRGPPKVPIFLRNRSLLN